MRVFVRVIPNAKKAEVERIGEDAFKVKVDAPATKGKANKRLIEILSDYFHVPKSRISIVSGAGSRKKILRISEGGV